MRRRQLDSPADDDLDAMLQEIIDTYKEDMQPKDALNMSLLYKARAHIQVKDPQVLKLPKTDGKTIRYAVLEFEEMQRKHNEYPRSNSLQTPDYSAGDSEPELNATQNMANSSGTEPTTTQITRTATMMLTKAKARPDS